MQAEGHGESLLEAVDELAAFWAARPSLVPHNWGVLTLTVTIGTTEATFQVTDPDILDALEIGDTGPLIEYLAQEVQLSPQDMELLLSESTEVSATVDRIRPPADPTAWQPDTGMEPSSVLPDATMDWMRDVGRQIEEEARRDRGRIRTRRARKLLRLVVLQGDNQGLTVAQISRRTGIPRSTVRDAKGRITREKRVVKEFKARRPGQRFTPDQTQLVIERLKDTGNNAAETARQLGIPPRTVRDIRARQTRQQAVVAAPRRKYTEQDKTRLMRLVAQGTTPTEASRQLGIPARTARGWARKERLRKEDED